MTKNSLEIKITSKVNDSPLNKLKEKINKINPISDKVENKMGKITNKVNINPIEKLRNKMSKVGEIGTKLKVNFDQLKGRVKTSFPVSMANHLRNSIRSIRGETDKTSKSFDFLKGKMMKIIGVVSGFFAISKAISFLNTSIDNYKADMVNTTKLKSQIEANVQFKVDKRSSQEIVKSFQSQASKIQAKGVFGDEMMVGAQASMLAFQMSEKSINNITPKVADIVAGLKGLDGTKEDFENIGKTIGNAISGGKLKALQSLKVPISEAEAKAFKLMNTQERTAYIEKILNERVSNTNEELSKTPLGQIVQAQNAWGDMQELIGEAAIKVKGKFAPYIMQMIPIVEKLGVGIIEGIGKGIDFIQNNFEVVKDFFMNIFSNLNFGNIIKNLKGIFESIKGAVGGFNLTSLASGIIAILNGIISLIDWTLAGLKPIISFLAPIFIFIINQISKAMKWLMPIISVLVKITAIFGVIAGVILLAFNPITWIVAGFIGLIAIVNNFGEIIRFVFNSIFAVVFTVVNTIVIHFKTTFGIIGVFIQYKIFEIISYFQLIINTVKNVLSLVVALFNGDFGKAKEIAKKIIDDIKGFFTGLIDKAIELGNRIKDAFKVDLKGLASGVGKIFGIGKNYNGTRSWRGGLTTVAEKGAEMIKMPNKAPFLAQSEMLLNLPQGTEIDTAESTKRILGSVSGRGSKENITTTNTTKNDNSKSKVVFAPNFTIYNSSNDNEIEKKVNKALNDFFESKMIGIGG